MALTKQELKQDKQNFWYWNKREEAQAESLAKISNKRIKSIEKQMQKYYAETMEQVIYDFEATYNKLLTTIEDGRQPTPADLYKLDKYWKLQAQCRTELEKLGAKQLALLSKEFETNWFEIYNSISVEGATAFSTVDKSMVGQMINQIWAADGKSWSSRVWDNTNRLQQTLNDELIHIVAAGKKSTDLKNILQERFSVSYSRADALVRTEISHIQNQAAQKRYEDYGVEEVEIWADKDERRCDVCGKLHKKRYPVGAKIPIPAHPRCRCSIVPVVDVNKKVEKLAQGSYNGINSSFKDNVNFETNRDVKKAVQRKQRIFVTPLTGKEKTKQEFFHNLFGENVANTPSLNGYYDIAAHGLPNSIEIFKTPINSETLAKIIMGRNDYKKGTPIRLLSCFTGDDSSGTCIAKELAQMLETEVIAPPFELVVGDSGQLYKYEGKERIIVTKKDFRRFKPNE